MKKEGLNLLTIYSQEELKKIQSIELECLNSIVGICKKIGVEYFLIGGSVLGAVRHGGYIPWDDDIDIGMTRDNYRKFLKEAPTLLPAKYHLQTPYNDKKCPYFYTKVRVDGTVFMEYCNRHVNMHHGVYIDIFPFDNVPDEETLNKQQFNKVQSLLRKFTLRQIPDVSEAPTTFCAYAIFFIRRCVHYIAQCVYPYQTLTKKLEEEITKYNHTETKAMACLNFPTRKTEYIKKSDLYPLKLHKFEDLEFFIPNNDQIYLSTHYGDYMQQPPENKRFGHKPYLVNLDKYKS